MCVCVCVCPPPQWYHQTYWQQQVYAAPPAEASFQHFLPCLNQDLSPHGNAVLRPLGGSGPEGCARFTLWFFSLSLTGRGTSDPVLFFCSKWLQVCTLRWLAGPTSRPPPTQTPAGALRGSRRAQEPEVGELATWKRHGNADSGLLLP